MFGISDIVEAVAMRKDRFVKRYASDSMTSSPQFQDVHVCDTLAILSK